MRKIMKMNKLEKSEAFIHPIGIKCTQSVNESHLFGFAAIISLSPLTKDKPKTIKSEREWLDKLK